MKRNFIFFLFSMRYQNKAEADRNTVTRATNKLLNMHRHKVVALKHGEPK